MRFAISKDILKSTTRCRNNFACLQGDGPCFCVIEDCVDEKVHFIVPGAVIGNCDYRMDFGFSYTCNCPVRKEIYNQYRL